MSYIFGNEFNNDLYGTLSGDIIIGKGGRDKIFASNGDDLIFGDHAAWYPEGGDPFGGEFAESIDSREGFGNDFISAGSGDDIVYGGRGDDYIKGGSGNDQLFGGSDNDVLEGGTGNDVLEGGSGNDILEGNSGYDNIQGGSGSDHINGGSGNDVLEGGSGDDDITGGGYSYNSAEYDELISGNTNDTDRFILGNGSFSYYRGNGFATITDFDDYNFQGDISDKLVLYGSASDYYILTNTNGVSFVYYDEGNAYNLIARINTLSNTGINLNVDVEWV